MKNILFPEEDILDDDLYFMCYIIERTARTLHQKNKYVVNKIGQDGLKNKICVASVLHCENPLQVVDDFVDEFGLESGDFDITNVDRTLVGNIPTELQMGKVYSRLILQTLTSDEDYIQGLI